MKESIELNQLFADLEARLSALDPKVSLGLKRDQWLLVIISVGLLMTLVGSSKWLGIYSGWVVLVGIALAGGRGQRTFPFDTRRNLRLRGGYLP